MMFETLVEECWSTFISLDLDKHNVHEVGQAQYINNRGKNIYNYTYRSYSILWLYSVAVGLDFTVVMKDFQLFQIFWTYLFGPGST